MNDFRKIDTTIAKIIAEGKTKFVIYPFGENGIKVKEILNWRYGVSEVMIVDNNLARLNPNIISIDKVKNLSEYTWILTCNSLKTRKEIYASIAGLVTAEQIVDIFKPLQPYSSEYKLLSLIGGEEDTRKPCTEFIELVKRKKYEHRKITIAEIGVGYGTTSVEACKYLDENDTYVCYDFEEVVSELVEDLKKVPGISCKLVSKGNTHKTFDSYVWELSNALFEMRNKNLNGLYDVVYLDGFHSFFHDGAACCLIKELLKPGGYIVFDDMKWAFAKSRTLNPNISPRTREWFTEDQINDCQVQRVVNAFIIDDERFEPVYMIGNINSGRAVFRKMKSNYKLL